MNKPERVFGIHVRVGNWIFSKYWEFFEKLFGNFLDFLRNFFEGFFLEEFFLEEFFWRKSLFTLLKLFEYGRN